MDVLVKVSGDLVADERFYNWLSSIISSSDKLSILCGGGTAITEILKKVVLHLSSGLAEERLSHWKENA